MQPTTRGRGKTNSRNPNQSQEIYCNRCRAWHTHESTPFNETEDDPRLDHICDHRAYQRKMKCLNCGNITGTVEMRREDIMDIINTLEDRLSHAERDYDTLVSAIQAEREAQERVDDIIASRRARTTGH